MRGIGAARRPIAFIAIATDVDLATCGGSGNSGFTVQLRENVRSTATA